MTKLKQKLMSIFFSLKNFFSTPPKSVVTPVTIYDRFYETALAEFGTSEKFGDEDNPRIIEYHSATTLKAQDDETSWCSSFVCWTIEKCGEISTKSASARSWLSWGVKLDKPVKGCIVVLSRPPNPYHGHVGFFDHEDAINIFILGGNQDGSVKVKAYPKTRLLSYRGVKS